MPLLHSTLLETFSTSKNSLRMTIVKDNTKAYDEFGQKYTITPEALSQDYVTWEGGHVTVNHKVREKGILSDLEYKDGFVWGTVSGLSDEAMEVVNSKAFRGVSQESQPLELNGTDVTRLQGKGVTLVVYPAKPACSQTAGCGVVASTEPDSNFPLNTHSTNCKTGGMKLPENEPDASNEIDELKSTIADLTKQLESKDAELTKLESTIDSTVQTAVKAALEAQENKQQYDAAVETLSTLMSTETMTEFMAEKPSIGVIKSTITVLEKTINADVGAAHGTVGSTTQTDEISDTIDELRVSTGRA